MKTKNLIHLYITSIVVAILAGVMAYMNANNYKVLLTILISIWMFSLPVSYVMWFKLLDELSFEQGSFVGSMFKIFGLLITPILLFPYLNYRFYKHLFERKEEKP